MQTLVLPARPRLQDAIDVNTSGLADGDLLEWDAPTATFVKSTNAALLSGRSGGQTLYGGTGSGESLTLGSTSHGTKGFIYLGASTGYDAVNLRLGIGTAAPAAKLQLTGNNSLAAWGVDGTALRVAASTLTDTTSSGTVATVAASSYGTPTLAAGSATVFTDAAAVYIASAPAAGSNVTVTNGYALWVDDGNVRLDGQLSVGVSAAPSATLHLGGNVSLPAWTAAGPGFRIAAATYTDTTSSGTTANAVIHSIGTTTLAANSVTTFTNVACLYIANSPQAGTNTTITNAYALWVDNGNVRFDGFVGVGGVPAGQLHVAANASAAAWTTNGVGIRFNALTYTDTSSTGTVARTVVHGIATPTLAASSSTVYTRADALSLSAPVAGTNVSIGTPWCVALANAGIIFGGNISAEAWTTSGIRQRWATGTFTDTTSSGTVAQVYCDLVAGPTFAASNTTVYTVASTLRVTAPIAGTNVTITNQLALDVSGSVRITGFSSFGSTAAPPAVIYVSGNQSSAAWSTNGLCVRIAAATYTDTSSSGTVANNAVHGIATPTLAASTTTTYTAAATLFIAAAPAAGTNVTITSGYALWVNAGTSRFVGDVQAVANLLVGSSATAGTSAAGVIAIHSGTLPGSSPTDTAQIYAEDQTAGNTVIKIRNESGVVLQLYRPNSYTQTFSTASRTMNSYTADNESVAYTGIDNAQVGSVYAQLADLNALRVAVENLRATVENRQEVLNAVIDDHQSIGFFG